MSTLQIATKWKGMPTLCSTVKPSCVMQVTFKASFGGIRPVSDDRASIEDLGNTDQRNRELDIHRLLGFQHDTSEGVDLLIV